MKPHFATGPLKILGLSALLFTQAQALDTDISGKLDCSIRSDFDKEFSPNFYNNHLLSTEIKVKLNEGMFLGAELENHSSEINANGDREISSIYDGKALLSDKESREADIKVRSLSFGWTLGYGIKLAVGDLYYDANAMRNYHDYSESRFYSTGIKEHAVRGLHLDMDLIELYVGFPLNNSMQNDSAVSIFARAQFQAIDSDEEKLMVKPWAEINLNHARTRVWNLGVEGDYSKALGYFTNFDLHAGLSYLDVKHNAVFSLLAEPTLSHRNFSIRGTAYWATLNEESAAGRHTELAELDMPVEMMFFAEPMITVTNSRKLAMGLPVGWFNPVFDDKSDNYSHMGFAMHIFPTTNAQISTEVRYNERYQADDFWQMRFIMKAKF